MRNVLRVFVVGLWLGGLIFGGSSAQANPTTVNAGQTVIFNFDFVGAGVLPSPGYATLNFITGTDLSTLGAGDAGSWSFFSGLNGSNLMWGGTSLNTSGAGFGGPGGGVADDGIFSVALTMTSGSISVDPYAYGVNHQASPITLPNGEIWTANVYPTVANVPEPETYALMLVGLGVICTVRRCRKSNDASRCPAR